LFYSDDAGANWDKVAGNLEENASGSGNGPSCRTAQIIDFGNSTLYVVGTSIGLFATDNLDGQNTVWEMIGKDEIGNVIIEQIDYRHSDGRFTVATYGRGIFQTTITSVDDVLSLDNVERKQLSIYPNPSSDIINVEFTANKSERVRCVFYNEVGKEVKSNFENINTGINKLTFDVNTLKTGVYFVSLQLNNETITNQFIKK
jgi:hypothetical protein